MIKQLEKELILRKGEKEKRSLLTCLLAYLLACLLALLAYLLACLLAYWESVGVG